MPRRSEMMRSARSGSEQSRQSNDQFAGHTGLLFGTLALHHRPARRRLDARQINAVGGECTCPPGSRAPGPSTCSSSRRDGRFFSLLHPGPQFEDLRGCARNRDADFEARTAVSDFLYEIACSGGQDQEGAAQAWADRDASPLWTALPGLSALDLYQPVRGGTRDPFNSDGPGPLLMAMLQFPSKDKLEAGLSDPCFA